MLQPLKFLEYLLEDVVETAIIGQTGAAIVNIPAPERYAVHKLIVSEERIGRMSNPKRIKDLSQAAELFGYFREVRPEAIETAWAAIVERGPGWAKRARAALTALDRIYPEMHAKQWLDPSIPRNAKQKGRKKGLGI